MSGLYNMLMGRNPAAPYLLACIGITEETQQNYPLGRYRDTYTNENGDRVFIFTRNYGTEWENVDQALGSHPNFVQKFADDFDHTYTTYEFTVPENMSEIVKQIATMSDNTPPMVAYRKLISDMENGVKNEVVDRALKVGEGIMNSIVETMAGKEKSEISNEDGAVVIQNLTPRSKND